MPTQSEKNQALDVARRARAACARSADRQAVAAAQTALDQADAALAAVATATAS